MAGTLTSHEIFGFLTPDQVNAISERAEHLSFEAGENVYMKGDDARNFFIVLDGEVTLRLPGQGEMCIVIDQLGRGDVFGGPLGGQRQTYLLTAHCTQDATVLRIENSVMRSLMEQDQRMGYHLQSHISEAYYNRYVDTMKKLQSIVMSIPVEA